MYFPDFYQVDFLELKLIFLFKDFLFYYEFIFRVTGCKHLKGS